MTGLEHKMFVEVGTGIDLHGQDVTRACLRTCRDAIGHNSMPGMLEVLPGGDVSRQTVEVTLGVPYHQDEVNIEAVQGSFPYGTVSVKVVQGGLLASSGILLPDQGDDSDMMVIVNAVVTVGY